MILKFFNLIKDTHIASPIISDRVVDVVGAIPIEQASLARGNIICELHKLANWLFLFEVIAMLYIEFSIAYFTIWFNSELFPELDKKVWQVDSEQVLSDKAKVVIYKNIKHYHLLDKSNTDNISVS